MNSDFTSHEWRRLRALRDRFLTDASNDYWTPGDLELYDATFAQRIGWKWDGVLEILDRAGWRPSGTAIFDWGCGTGIATRAVVDWCGIRAARVHDQSVAAARFAVAKLRERGLEAGLFSRGEEIPPGTLLLISHVAGELTGEELMELAGWAAGADEVIWVEPGSREISLRLSAAREVLRAGGHRFIAPCTHDGACPMVGQEKDWCHFFGTAPAEIFQSAFWRRFSDQLEIDLRALPFSFLVASRAGMPGRLDGPERLIGKPRVLKGRCELLCCGAGGLATRTLQKRDAPDVFRRLCKDGVGGVLAWDRDPGRPGTVRGGEITDLK